MNRPYIPGNVFHPDRCKRYPLDVGLYSCSHFPHKIIPTHAGFLEVRFGTEHSQFVIHIAVHPLLVTHRLVLLLLFDTLFGHVVSRYAST